MSSSSRSTQVLTASSSTKQQASRLQAAALLHARAPVQLQRYWAAQQLQASRGSVQCPHICRQVQHRDSKPRLLAKHRMQ
jgi:hypothetical protein